MSTIRVVGIDIAKSVFQVCVWMVDDSVKWNKKVSYWILSDSLNQELLLLWRLAQLRNSGGRTFAFIAYCVRLTSAQHVKEFVRSKKNDANNALTICDTTLLRVFTLFL